jgi:hypothetical protein
MPLPLAALTSRWTREHGSIRMTVSASPPPLRPASIGRAAAGVLCATLASLAALVAFIVLATTDVPADEGDSWVRGAIGMILLLPVLASFLAGYYVAATLLTYFMNRWRLAGLAGLAVVTTGAFTAWAAPRDNRDDLLVLASSLMLADLLLGSGVIYFIYGRRLTPSDDRTRTGGELRRRPAAPHD